MTLREFLYRLEGEVDDPANCDLRIVFVTQRGTPFEPLAATPTVHRDLLIVNLREAEGLS